MTSLSGQGVKVVMLLRFSTMGDPQRNFKKVIQMFKGGFKLNGWYKSKPSAKATEGGADTMPDELKRLAKGKTLAAFRSTMAGNKEFDNLVRSFEL